MTTDDREQRHERWLVSGRVQGVGFRWFVLRSARREGVLGDVCNLPDGRVEIRAIGPAGALAALLIEVRGGPPGAQVDDVAIAPLEAVSFSGFGIRD